MHHIIDGEACKNRDEDGLNTSQLPAKRCVKLASDKAPSILSPRSEDPMIISNPPNMTNSGKRLLQKPYFLNSINIKTGNIKKPVRLLDKTNKININSRQYLSATFASCKIK